MVRSKRTRKGHLAPFYRKPGGTTGTPRVQKKPATPILTINLAHNAPAAHPGPAHGVSGFQTTGLGGQYNAVRSSSGIPTVRTSDSSASRFGVAVSGAADRVRNSYIGSRPPPPPTAPPTRGGRSYVPIGTVVHNRPTRTYPVYPPPTGGPPPYTPRTPSSIASSDSFFGSEYSNTSPIRKRIASANEPTTYGPYTSEPTFERELEDVAVSTAPYTGLHRHQRLQAERNPFRRSALDRQAEMGYYSGDTYMQNNLPMLDRGRATNIAQGDITTPIRPLRLQFSPTPTVNPRNADGHQGSGTVNNVASIGVQTPMGQSTLPFTMDQTTPGVATVGYSSNANHPAFGPSGGPTPGVDGSWTLNIMPGQAQPTLATLAPAADIPIRNAGPGRLGTTSLFASNSGGTGRMGRRMM